MSGLAITSILQGIVSVLQHVGKILIGIICFVIITSILMNVLPGDPFRGIISGWASFIAPYGAFINTFIPVGFIASSTLFVVAVKYFMWIYRKLYGIFLDTSADDMIDI